MSKLKNYYHFLMNTKKLQIMYRLFFKYHRRKGHKRVIKLLDNPKFRYIDEIKPSNQTFKLDDLLNNKMEFMNKTYHFKNGITFNNPEMPLLWDFHLNYFDYLKTIMHHYQTHLNQQAIDWALKTIQTWIQQSNTYNVSMWSPYTVSLRIVNWLQFMNFINTQVQNIDLGFMEKSLYQQFRYLEKNMELDIEGNHLIENLKTLILTSLIIDDPIKAAKYLRKLNQTLNKQVLSDGCHYEKSISYHMVLLEGLIHILEWITLKEDTISIPLRDFSTLFGYTTKMYDFYDGIIYKEDAYPLLNDSNCTMTQYVEDMNSRWNALIKKHPQFLDMTPPRINKDISGYHVIKYHHYQIVFDTGNLGPNHLLAHAHNDIFNFELKIDGYPVTINDSGVSEYQKGAWRDFSRSTKAHNTVMINGLEQADMWNSFRVGWRPKKVNAFIEKDENRTLVNGVYQGKKYLHQRELSFEYNAQKMIILDKIKAKSKIAASSFLHFGVEYTIEQIQDVIKVRYQEEDILEITLLNVDRCILYQGAKNPLQGWSMPRFGVEIPRYTLEMLSYQDKELSFGYEINILV